MDKFVAFVWKPQPNKNTSQSAADLGLRYLTGLFQYNKKGRWANEDCWVAQSKDGWWQMQPTDSGRCMMYHDGDKTSSDMPVSGYMARAQDIS